MIKIDIQHQILTTEGLIQLKVDTQLQEGSFVRVSGPSGAGKTTLFRMIAGIIWPDYGSITVNQKTLVDRENSIFIPPQKRETALMFQNYALFPNMTVRENIAFAQKEKDVRYIDHLLEEFELTTLKNQRISKISGGQQQRVALARALAQQSSIVLLDEPLSAVDERMREKMAREIISFHQQNRSTIFIISHNEKDFIDIYDSYIDLC
ncbi:ATP-binding cassette domain-containing protein [Chryseobacterium sp.]|uniref:ATP-binding cassette domain-containing protein n=1 Tax=Chryseobacterium sp. TaxID=1871047 RepID=UPI002FC6FDCB